MGAFFRQRTAGGRNFSPDLDKLKVGDYFKITVLRRITLSNRSDRYCRTGRNRTACWIRRRITALLTCTPYGINTKRLLVRGVRCEVTEKRSRSGQEILSGMVCCDRTESVCVSVIVHRKRKRKKKEVYRQMRG